MKKLTVTAILASSFLLFGCGDPNQEIIDKVTKHIESRKDMFPYKLEFNELAFIPSGNGNQESGILCGEIKLSQKSNIKPDERPYIYFSNMSEEIEQVVGSNDFFKFTYTVKPDFDNSKEIESLRLIYPYDQLELKMWHWSCKE
ncbi:hypothetical protein [Providencia alcalifaciens]|uniref:hypothetical protein n=1 Tax=Providencia alcalifaciens TaxID=126385 RepID=UPI00029BE93B|nr:hypothetical protein [Providencia alcalifaciens]EKT65834.1 hypothetical protein OO9_08833 [Providencia alcalifaciens Dmel2]